jgi:hypothetical protein
MTLTSYQVWKINTLFTFFSVYVRIGEQIFECWGHRAQDQRVAQDWLQGEVLVSFPGKKLDIAVQLLTVQLANGPEQCLVEVCQGHSVQNCDKNTRAAKKGVKLKYLKVKMLFVFLAVVSLLHKASLMQFSRTKLLS